MAVSSRGQPPVSASHVITVIYGPLEPHHALVTAFVFRATAIGVGSQPAYDEPQKERVCVHHVPFALCFASHSLNYGTGHV